MTDELIQLSDTMSIKLSAVTEQDGLTSSMLGMVIYAQAMDKQGQPLTLWDVMQRFSEEDPIQLAMAFAKVVNTYGFQIDKGQYQKDLAHMIEARTGAKIQ